MADQYPVQPVAQPQQQPIQAGTQQIAYPSNAAANMPAVQQPFQQAGEAVPTTQSNNGALTVRDVSANVPAHLQQRMEMQAYQPAGIQDLLAVVRPPFVKIVQGSSDKTLKQTFAEMSVLAVPGNDMIAQPGQPIYFTPLLFFIEYLCLNDIKLKGNGQFILARTFDKTSDVAKRALNPELRRQRIENGGQAVLVNGEPVFMTYQEAFNFIVALHGVPNITEPVIISFRSAEQKTGRRLASLINRRHCDIYAGIYEARVNIHRNPQNDWYGFDIDNAVLGNGWVQDPKQFAEYEAAHVMLAKMHQERKIQMDYGDDDGLAGAGVFDPNAPSNGGIDPNAALNAAAQTSQQRQAPPANVATPTGSAF
jgi:hypothetical protein